MKLLFLQITLSLIALSLFQQIDFAKGVVDYQDETDFTVLMSSIVRFKNKFNAGKTFLTFSLSGVTIDTVAKANETTEEFFDDSWFQDNWNIESFSAGGGADDNTTAAPTTGNDTAAGNGTNFQMTLSDQTVVEMKFADEGNLTVFNFTWPGHDINNEKRELCLHYKDAHWYNTYQRYQPEWPMNNSNAMPLAPFNYLLDFQNLPLKEEVYLILEHLFFTSDGFAVYIDSTAPLFIRRDPKGSEPIICISVNNSYPYLVNNPDSTYRDIKVQFFAGENPKIVLDHVMANIIPKPTATPGDLAFTNPSFSVYSQYGASITRDTIYTFTTAIEKQGYWNSELIINNNWEVYKGDFHYNKGLFASFEEMTTRLHSEKFRVKVAVNPMIYDSNVNNKNSHADFYVKTATPENLLTNFINFGLEEACGFYAAQLQRIHYEYGIDSYYAVSDALRNFHLPDYLMQLTPSLLTKKYIETVAKASPNSTSTLGFKTQGLPIMVQLSAPATTPFDQLLRNMVSSALVASTAGYSFITPYHIGGFWGGAKPTEEIFIRMAQAAALMPSMTFSWAPWAPYFSDNAASIIKKMINLHQQNAPLILQLAQKRISDGTPIIRPMWYAEPLDERAFTVGDQFMLGDDIVVAPVLEVNQRQRSVFLPSGNWADSHGIVTKGPIIKKVAANLEDLPYFTRKA